MDLASRTISAISSPPLSPGPVQHDRLKSAATELEASFLFEMLKAAGLGKTRSEFGGGAGEDQFSSLLLQTQASQMAHSGGLGLAEAIYENLKERTDHGGRKQNF